MVSATPRKTRNVEHYFLDLIWQKFKQRNFKRALKEEGKGRIRAPKFLMPVMQAIAVIVPHVSLLILCHYKVNWSSVLPFFQIVWQTSECRILLYFAKPPSHFVCHSKVSFCTFNHPIVLESKIFFCFRKAFSPLGWQRCKVFEIGNNVARKMVTAVKARLLRPHYLTYQMHQTLFSVDDLVMEPMG